MKITCACCGRIIGETKQVFFQGELKFKPKNKFCNHGPFEKNEKTFFGLVTKNWVYFPQFNFKILNLVYSGSRNKFLVLISMIRYQTRYLIIEENNQIIFFTWEFIFSKNLGLFGGGNFLETKNQKVF